MASTYTQANVKRQKLRDAKTVDTVDYFQGIDKVEYNSMASTSDTLVYKYYSASERIHGRCMDDWLKLSISFTAFKYNGSDKFGKPTYNRNWDDSSNSVDNYKRHVKAFFDMCQKLGVKYWTAFDTDLVPVSENLDEFKNNMEEMVEFILENCQRYHCKLLWIAPDLHSHSRYASGAATNNDASTFAQAAAQTKQTIEMGQKLNAENILLWPIRENFNISLKTDMQREIKLFGKFLKMAAEFKDRVGFRGQMLILPRFFDGCQSYYMWDATSCVCLLKQFHLERGYKIIVEPGPQMYITQLYNMLGGVQIRNGNKFEFDHKTFTLIMKNIVDQGTPFHSGISLYLCPNRSSSDVRDCVLIYVKHIDLLAKSLRTAASMVSEQIFTKLLQQRYSSYYSGFGGRLLNGDVTLEECDEHVRKSTNSHQSNQQSSKSEHWDIMFHRYLDNCDHI